jgi:diguanylate cyclase (GGDEF)-like protein/PAS domain S-box-containing protein
MRRKAGSSIIQQKESLLDKFHNLGGVGMDHNNKNTLPIPKSLLTNLRDATIIIDQNGFIIYGNESACKLFERRDIEGLSISVFMDFQEIQDISKQKLYKLQTEKQPIVELTMVPLEKNELYCLIIHPIQLNEERQSMVFSLKNMVHEAYEGMLLHENGKIIDCDPSFAQMLGYTRVELLNQSIASVIDSNRFQILEEEIEEGVYQFKGRRKSGETIYMEVFSKPFFKENNQLQIAIVRDITEGVISKKQIEFMAYYDELTDLPNRNFFSKTLKEAIEDCKQNNTKLAVHFLDIDYFKQINDSLGYQFGDEMLKVCSERLKGLLDENNFIARMGGDEFLILQRNIQNHDDAKKFARKVINAFQTPIIVNEFEIYTSVSIGISLFPDNGETPNDLIKHADSAMYVIKDKQRNHYQLFDSSISDNFREMLTMENELRKAIKEQQFELHYQPQVNIHTNKVIGFEALLRWKHPEKGYIPPGVFIPLAEKTGLIIEIGTWVLKEACKQNKEWQLKGYRPTKISVNLSVKQFLQKNLVHTVQKILGEVDLEPEFLELEITESMAMTNEAFIMDTLKGLHELGVKVSIDDFGTGYSSMKYLSEFPLSKLKIDQLFIRENKEQNQAIVKSIIHLSHALNMKVIAEGVETEEQLRFLKKEKCDEIQGYYFSKPVPAKDAEVFFH